MHATTQIRSVTINKGGKCMRFRKSALLILVSLLMVFVAACGGGNKNANGGDGGKGSGNGGNSTNNEVDTGATPEMDFDLGGKTIRLVSWYGELPGDASVDDLKKKENLERLQEKHNFTLEMVTIDYGEYRDKVTTSIMSGQPVGEIIRIPRPWMIPTLTSRDLFWPVDEYVTNYKVFQKLYTTDFSQYNGRGYGFRIGKMGAAGGIAYNRTLMQELGIPELQKYVDEDNWNWETFIEVAKSANRDRDNDGKLDVWGLTTTDIFIPLLASNEAHLFKNGKETLEDPKTIEVLNFMNRLVTENVARPTEGGDWTEPKMFFQQGNVLMTYAQDYDYADIKNNMPDYDIGFLPFPKGPSATQYQTHNTIPNYYTIPKAATDHPEWLVYIIEKIHDIDSIYDYPEQKDFETFFHNEDDLNNARLAVQSFQLIEQVDYYPNMRYYEFVGELRDGVSVSTLIEKYKPVFQAAVDEVWGGIQ